MYDDFSLNCVSEFKKQNDQSEKNAHFPGDHFLQQLITINSEPVLKKQTN